MCSTWRPSRSSAPSTRAVHEPAHASVVDESAGIYDTLLVEDGHVVELDAHLARLDASVRAVYGTTIRAGLDEAVGRRAAGLTGRHRLRIDAVPDGSDVAVSDHDPPARRRRRGLDAHPALDARGGLGQHKWADRRALAHDGPPDRDLLLIADDGSVLETARANIFVVHDDAVLTPAHRRPHPARHDSRSGRRDPARRRRAGVPAPPHHGRPGRGHRGVRDQRLARRRAGDRMRWRRAVARGPHHVLAPRERWTSQGAGFAE